MSLKGNKKIVKMLGVFWIQNRNSQNKIILETLQNSDEPRTFIAFSVTWSPSETQFGLGFARIELCTGSVLLDA